MWCFLVSRDKNGIHESPKNKDQVHNNNNIKSLSEVDKSATNKLSEQSAAATDGRFRSALSQVIVFLASLVGLESALLSSSLGRWF